MWTEGTSWKRRRRFSTMKFFLVVCGPPTAFVVTACGNHVARGTIGWSAYHFANEVHLPRSNHVAYTGDGVEHLSHFVVVQSLFANFGH